MNSHLDSESPVGFVVKSFAIQVGAVISSLLFGVLLTFYVHPYVVPLVPIDGYGPLVAWIVSAIVGYIGSVAITATIILVGASIYYVVKRNKSSHIQR